MDKTKRISRVEINKNNDLVIFEDISLKEKKTSYSVGLTTTNKKTQLRKVVLNGAWRLTPENDLEYRLVGSTSRHLGKSILFRGILKDPSGSLLSFSAKRIEGFSGKVSSRIDLKGRWQSDRNNRITFIVSRAQGASNTLRFEGAWEANKNNLLVYRYSKTHLKTKVKQTQILIFKGFWAVGKNRLVYRLEGRSDSSFSFKAAFQTRSIRAKAGAIKYQVGIIYSRGGVKRTRKQTVTIFGTWKLSKDLSLEFTVKSYGSKSYRISLGIQALIWEKGKLKLSLTSDRNKDLGVDLVFTKKFTSDAELFLALAQSKQESKIIGGMRVKF